MQKDEQNQLVNRGVRAEDVFDRKVDELIGICRGLLADDVVNQREAEFLLSWLESNRDFAPQYPFTILYERLSNMLKDGVLDEEEQEDLLSVLTDLTGGKVISGNSESMSSTLPVIEPLPNIAIPGSSFVFTGVFNTGTRKQLERLTIDLGGTMHNKIRKDTDFLVIGDIGSKDWAHSSYGRKIEQAVKYRDEANTGIVIIPESHWAKFL